MRTCYLCFERIIHEEQPSPENYFEDKRIDGRPGTKACRVPGAILQNTASFGLIFASSYKSAEVCTGFVQNGSIFVGQATRKAIRTEVGSGNTVLPPPRFDEVAALRARPVVPLTAESPSTNYTAATNSRLPLKPRLSKKGSWLLAALAGLILTVGAMAVGVTTYRRSQTVPTQPLAPTAEAVRLELDQEPRVRRSTGTRATATMRAPASRSSAPVIVRTKKREQPVRPIRPVADGSSRPRLVDSYVVRRP